MSRPSSAKRPGSAKQRQGEVSYEDLLVAQYLDELRKSPPYTKATAQAATSPYLSKLTHTHVVPSQGARRPHSAYTGSKPRIDPKFIADHTLWDPATPRQETANRRRRPASAPVSKRPLSAYSTVSSRPTSAKSSVWGGGPKRVRSLYKRQPLTIVCTAFKNGCRDVFARVAAPNIKMLLEICTEKLGLPNAGRRVFLDDGTEVFTPKEIPRDSEVFVSMGESFKDPFKGVKEQTVMGKNVAWTMNGLVWQQEIKKKDKKTKMTKRFKRLIDQSRRRVLVFKNGQGSQGIEIVANPERFEDFLVACTAKLDLGSYARVLYDWSGHEIQNLEDAPVLDSCLQTWSTPVLGPLWVSKGEGFSPKGVSEFLSGLIQYTRAKLKEAKHYQEQLRCAQDEDTKDNVEIVAILSMSEEEIEETLEIVQKDIDDFSNALGRLKEQMEKIKGLVSDEIENGNEYKMKHIKKFDASHRMVGTKGIRLKVYENGTYEDETIMYFNLQKAARGIGHEKKKLMERLLDELSNSTALSNPKKTPALHLVAKKIYNNLGKEIKDVYELEYDQEVWLSFGDPWKNPFTYVMSACFDKVRVFDIQEGENQRKTAIREQLMAEDISPGMDRSSRWECYQGLPEEFEIDDRNVVSSNMDPMEREGVLGLIESSEIGIDNGFLQSKDDERLMLYSELVVDNKKSKGSKEAWPHETQVFIINKAGYICSKPMPQMVLGVSDQKVTCNLSHPTKGPSETKVEGYAVTMQKKDSGTSQQWTFTPEGFICPQNNPDVVLTYLGAQFSNEDSQIENEEEEKGPNARKIYVAVCEKMEGANARNQRWALKQERMDNLGQWKYTQADNPEWNKKALSWPVNKDGSVNEDYDWPMEGFMLPYAPPIQKAAAGSKSQAQAPLRLVVLKNGVRDISKAMPIVGPDLTNMKKDMHQRKDKKKKSEQNHENADTESIDVDYSAHCNEDLTVLKLEMILFLERCTSMINLPFAARRIFDENGKEHFTLRSLQRDQLIYVSCGEAWSDPNLSKAEQQRRYLLANLSSDVSQIRQYTKLRSPENLVLEVEGGICPGARIIINECVQEEEGTVRKSHSKSRERAMMEDGLQEDREDAVTGKLTAHEQAHLRAEERLNNLKWPWERIMNGGVDEVADANTEEAHFSNKDMYQRYKPRKKRTENQALQAQKFRVEDGYIACVSDSNLVLGVHENEGRVSEVVLVKRRPDDIFQRWILQENGIIQSKHNPQMVLSVAMPNVKGEQEEEEDIVTYQGCPVVLQQRKSNQFGRANQRWYFDESTGFLQAFHTDLIDKEITSANKANVCTFSVMGSTEIDQSGYMVEMQENKGTKPKKLLVCSSCARAMRGRHKIEKLKDSIDFACAMGNAKEIGVRQIGSFQCLNGKVDLSTYEAEHTLEEWEGQLARLREELSVRQIAKEISAARVPYTVKVLVYKNGDGRLKPGELIVSSSVAGVLEQATNRLNLGQAARRLYTSDGMIVLGVDDLVEWVREQYVKEARKQMKAEARAKKQAQLEAEGKDEPKMMERVELDSDESDEEVAAPAQQEEEDEEDEEDETEFLVGYEASDRRQIVDTWTNFIFVPNPNEWIEEDGYITQWNLYAKNPGTVYFMALRQSKEDMNSFTILGQHGFNIGEAGEHTFDVTKSPIEVKEGDRIGFYCPETANIPYDVDEENNDIPFFCIPLQAPEVGQSLKMDSLIQQRGQRKYSLNAKVVIASKMEEMLLQEKKKAKASGKKKPHIDPPPHEMVLRYPIEVWVSGGEEFVQPERVEKNYEDDARRREQRAAVSYELQKEKHVLRQMQGRRYQAGAPGEFMGTSNPERPVYIQGHWQEAPMDELLKHDTVHQLQTHLYEVKANQKKSLKMCNVSTTNRLYTQPSMIRVLVFPNGDTIERAQYVWGETLDQLCDNATNRLNLRKPGKHLFTIEGKLVLDFTQLERDQLLCVSPSKQFLVPKDSRMLVEIKANWGRARKQYGPGATDLVITANKHPQIDVDPFGPSTLTGGPTKPKKSAYPTTHAKDYFDN